MATNRDAILLESTTTHRSRLRAAFLFGEQEERRVASDNIRRFIGSVVLAAVACAVCIGVSFVTNVLETQAAEKEKAAQEATSTPTPEPTTEPTTEPTEPTATEAPVEETPPAAPPAEPTATPTETTP